MVFVDQIIWALSMQPNQCLSVLQQIPEQKDDILQKVLKTDVVQKQFDTGLITTLIRDDVF